MKGYLRIKNVSKFFPGVKALDDVSFDIRIGEVHVICGENGAGKSTLMNILSGNYIADSGSFFYDEEECVFHNPYAAQQAGFAIVHQERSLVNNLSVAENIFVNRQPTKSGVISKKEMYARTRKILDRLKQTDIQPGDLVGRLSPAKQQMVEICKALEQNPKVLILDEPTATVTEVETAILFDTIRELKADGVTIVYISHRLAEIFEICDRVSVLRDGKYQKTCNIKDIVVDDIVKMMVGRDISDERFESYQTDEEVLRVENLSGGRFQNVSFTLHRGEVLGFAGLAGAGRTEVARAIIGADPKTGDIYVHGKKIHTRHPSDAIQNGIGYLPEDRKQDGLFLGMSIEDNIISGNLPYAAPKKLFQKSIITKEAEKAREKLRIVTPSVKRAVHDLSGGNQQKVVIGKWLLVDSEILIVDEPTRGIDVGAKDEIYKLIRDMVASGKSVIMISSDLPEVLRMSDNIAVMYNGSITGILNNRGQEPVGEELIMKYASGLKTETV